MWDRLPTCRFGNDRLEAYPTLEIRQLLFPRSLLASVTKGRGASTRMATMNRKKSISLDSVTSDQLTGWMKSALEAGESGAKNGENPFGAAIYQPDGTRIVVAHNTVISSLNPTRHAEINAIAAASSQLGRSDLAGFWLLATAEPCPMCLSAAVIAGIRHIAFGANQAVIDEAGYGGLGVTSSELASQIHGSLTLRGSILGDDCVRFMLNNRKRS